MRPAYKNKRLNPQQRELCEKHIKHAVKIAADYCRKRGITHRFEDVKASAWFGLVDAAYLFDELRGVKFSTFLQRRVLGQIVEDIRVRPKCKQPLHGVGSLDAMRLDDDGEPREMIGYTSDAESRINDASEVSRLLSRFKRSQQLAYRMYYGHGYTFKQIGKAIGCHESNVCHMLKGMQAKLEASHAD